MPRLFVGLEIPNEISAALGALRGGLPGARWQEPSDYHITLRFIGDIDRRAAREIEQELAEIEREALAVTLSGLGTFGGDKPHTLYAAIAPSRGLLALKAETERAARRIGLKPEPRSKFTPHITLARLRAISVLDLADYLTLHGGDGHGRFTVERFALFSAREICGGGPYIVEAAYAFQPLREPV